MKQRINDEIIIVNLEKLAEMPDDVEMNEDDLLAELGELVSTFYI